jgi:hypothetical protein
MRWKPRCGEYATFCSPHRFPGAACDILLSTHTGLAPGADGRFITSAGDLGGSPRHRLNPRLCRSCASAASLPATSFEAPVLLEGGRSSAETPNHSEANRRSRCRSVAKEPLRPSNARTFRFGLRVAQAGPSLGRELPVERRDHDVERLLEGHADAGGREAG